MSEEPRFFVVWLRPHGEVPELHHGSVYTEGGRKPPVAVRLRDGDARTLDELTAAWRADGAAALA